MRVVKICYKVNYGLKKIFALENTDFFYESLIVCYYKFFKSRKRGIISENKRKRKLIVSMTSIPSRIEKVWITVESILRQTYKPDKIILWLAEDEFRDIKLPDRLVEQKKCGLEIYYCDNLKAYKKIYFAAKEYSDDYIVTIDDDIIYAEDMLEKLVKTYKKNPGGIICHRSHCIKKRKGRLRPYNEWINYGDRKHIGGKYSFENFFTSGAGTFFPVFRLNREILNRDAFMELAPYADDVWLNFCAWISGIRTINTKGILGHIITIKSSSDQGLSRSNVMYRRNDEQIERVLEYLEIDVNQYLNGDT